MSDIPLEKKFALLCGIVRAQHFAWRETLRRLAPEIAPETAVKLMWEITGRDTAKAYLKHIDVSKPIAPQVAELVALSSRCMGEDATAEVTDDGHAAVVHRACPWLDWHRERNLLEECRIGCDAWFDSTVFALNLALEPTLRVKTVKTLTEGNDCCLRRIWVEPATAPKRSGT